MKDVLEKKKLNLLLLIIFFNQGDNIKIYLYKMEANYFYCNIAIIVGHEL